MQKVDIHKRFIDELALQRKGTVGSIIEKLGILTREGGSLKHLKQHLDEVDQIFYTVDYLIENNLVKEGKHYTKTVDFRPIDFIHDHEDTSYRPALMSAMPDYLEKYYGLEILVLPSFFKMIKNGYKTDQEKKELLNFWLPFVAAIVSAFLTAVFTNWFNNPTVICLLK